MILPFDLLAELRETAENLAIFIDSLSFPTISPCFSLTSNLAEKPFGISKSNWPSFSSPRLRRRHGQLLLFSWLVFGQEGSVIEDPAARGSRCSHQGI
jgi:hypothetical protein